MHSVVETRYGKVRGAQVDGVSSFLGIRYASAERFGLPRAPEPWVGVHDAIAFGPIAPQTSPDPTTRRFGIVYEQLPPPPSPPVPPVEDEDCQFLNVWTSSVDAQARRPVMVWLHSGFFMLGSGASGHGARLARQHDVVVVSLNHRLNVFGYSHLDDVAGGGDFRYSGNLGQLDIVAALEWVRDNIAAFGGDPSRVMVFGASGGGMKTAWLMSSPRARGLLHRAGIQSGPCLRLMERDAASEVSEALLAELGLQRSQCNELRTMPVSRLLAAYHKLRVRLRPERFTQLTSFAPVLDPELLPQHPFSPAAPAQSATIPMLIGWNREDMAFFMGDEMGSLTLSERALKARLAVFLGARAERAISLYRKIYPDASAGQVFIRAFSDYSIMAASLTQADRKVALGGAATYAYRFDWPSPTLDGTLGALHSLETHFVFDNIDMGRALTGAAAGAHALAKRVSAAWASFAASGVPATEQLPSWAPYNENRAVMLLDTQSRLAYDPMAEVRELLSGVAD